MNESDRIHLTVEGEKALRRELDQLKTEERPAVTAEIAEARAHGDLKENAEYHAARDRQGHVEARIRYLEGTIGSAQVVDITTVPYSGRVIFGTTVILLEVSCEPEVEHRYRLVGEAEADFKIGRLSITTPVAQGLLGKEVGETVDVETPSGLRSFEIREVRHSE